MRKFLITLFALLISGCASLNIFSGNFPKDTYEIEKIIIFAKAPTTLSDSSLNPDSLDKITQSTAQDATNSLINTRTISLDSKEYLGLRQLREKYEGMLKFKRDEDDFRAFEILSSLPAYSSITFTQAQGRISGSLACNRFSATYTWKDGDNIIVDDISFLRKFCDLQELVDLEYIFNKFFTGDFLVIREKSEKMILRSKNMDIYLRALT